MVNVVIAQVENLTWNIRIKWRLTLTTKSYFELWRSSSAFNKATYLRRLLNVYHWNRQKSIWQTFQKVSPTKGVRRLHCDLNWSQDLLHHISSLKGRISQLVYQICIYNSNMCITYSVFLTLPLRQYILNPDHAVTIKSIAVIEGLVFQEHPFQILDHRIKKLSIKQIL